MNTQSLPDLLLTDGINVMGYGILPKFVMLDTELTIQAKAIYAYFCSYAGSGVSVFPSRNKILADLGVGKNCYYKHFNLLTEQGYITIKQKKAQDSTKFSQNIYTLISKPIKFQNIPDDNNKNRESYNKICCSGIKSLGFGTIPKAVMIDTRLPIKAKAIYAYFCSYAGSGNSVFPKKEHILYHLGITENTYYKFYNLLKELDYITVVRQRIKGKLDINTYFLNENPTGHNNNINQNLLHLKNKDTKKQDTKKQDTNNNNSNNNNNNNNNHSFSLNEMKMNEQNKKCKNINLPDIEDTDAIDIVEEQIYAKKKIPYSYHKNRTYMTMAIHILTNWDIFYPNGYDDKLVQNTYNLFNAALIDMCCSTSTQVKGAIINYANVIDKINEIADFGISSGIYEYVNTTVYNFLNVIKSNKINNPLAYMKSCIWDCMQTYNIKIYGEIARYEKSREDIYQTDLHKTSDWF